MWYFVTFNKIFIISWKKGGSIACVNYLKLKHDVTQWKMIMPDKNQI